MTDSIDSGSPHRPPPRTDRWGLLLTGVTAIIGSGWLFAAAHAANLAGPAAIVSWILGAFITLLTAWCLAEAATLFPRMGGMGRYLAYSHGSLAGFLGDWACFAGIASTVPSEATASVQYLSAWDYPWARGLYDLAADRMTTSGVVAASALCVLYFFINYHSLQWLMRSMKAVTFFKMLVPLITCAALFAIGSHASNFTLVGDSFAPFGWAGVFSAITTAGIVFAFNGFQTPISYASEVQHPSRSLPFALFGSVGICLGIYLLLQIAYIAAMPPEQLARSGWRTLECRSPFIDLSLALDLNVIAILLYVDAFVSPSGTGLVDMGASARMLYGMEQDGYMPKALGRLHPLSRMPRAGLWCVVAICFIALWVLPSWNQLAAVVSVGFVLSYLCSPVAVASLRRIAPGLRRPVRMPAAWLVSFLAFASNSLLFYWSRWPLTGQAVVVVAAGLVIYLYYARILRERDRGRHLRGGLWFVLYLPVIALISWLGEDDFGGRGLLQGWASHAAVLLAAFVFFEWARRSAWVTPMLEEWRSISASSPPG